jgi:hypothetical protein
MTNDGDVTRFAVGVQLQIVSIQMVFDAMFLNDPCIFFCTGNEFERSKDRALQYATVN